MLLQCNNYVIKRQKLCFFIAKSPFSSSGKNASIGVCQKDTFLSFLLSLCIALMSCYLSFSTVALSQLSIRESEML